MKTFNDFPQLKKILSPYSPVETASVFSGLLLNPEYQSHQYRLEFAINACLSFCKGIKKPNRKIFRDVYKELEKSHIPTMEDPAEDIFISTLWLGHKSYKVALGLWEGGIPQTQIFLNVMYDLRKDVNYEELYKKIEKLLRISNIVIEKNNLPLNRIGNEIFLEGLNDIDSKNFKRYQESVTLEYDENLFDESVNLDEHEFDNLINEDFGNSVLEVKPIYTKNKKIILLLPTAITISIRRHIVNFFLSQFKSDFLLSGLKHYISKEIHNTRIFGKFDSAPAKFYNVKEINDFSFSEVVLEFDKGYFYHFIFVMDTLQNIESDWFSGFVEANEKVISHIDKQITSTKNSILNKDEYAKGCSILILCSLGRGLALSSNYNSDDTWALKAMGLDDLVTVSYDNKCTPHLIWRIIEAEEKLNRIGTTIINPNGFLNLYAYIKENDFSLILDQGDESGKQFNMLMIPTNMHVHLREDVMVSNERRETKHYEFGSLIVRRAYYKSYFDSDTRSKFYMTNELPRSAFRVVYLDDKYEIWIEQEILTDIDLSLQYQMFDTATLWFAKTMQALNEYGIKINNNIKSWQLKYEFPADLDELPKNLTKEKVLHSYKNFCVSNKYISHFNVEFIQGFSLKDNFSEQAMVLSLLNHFHAMGVIYDLTTIFQKIISDIAARQTHFFVAKKYKEYFIKNDDKAIYIESIDEGNIKLNLGWSVRDRELGNIIEGKEECKQYIQLLVAIVWEILQSKLKKYDRAILVEKLLTNVEVSSYQRERWKRTFKSVLSLESSNQQKAYDEASKIISLTNAATTSSRHVIEMAICEASVNTGKEAGNLDIQELICLASFMHNLGGLSEAINYDAVPPKITITGCGDVRYDNTFHNTIISSYGSKVHKNELQSSVNKYNENFTTSTPVKSVHHIIEVEFLEAFIKEFGYTIDDIREFVDFIEDLGMEINELVFNITYNELIEVFDERQRDRFKVILDSLIISPRNEWTKIPKPYKKNDWQPWRFRRRYSLAMKPIVQIDTFEKRLFISPQLVRDSFMNLLRNCYEAYLDEGHFQSKEMRRWIGETRSKTGLEFNSLVASKLEESGYITKEEIKLTEILNKKMEDFGDVDVLAWDNKKNIVYAIECKDLEFAKTEAEVAKQIYDFKGQINSHGKKDRLLKHVKRLKLLKEDISGIAKFTKLDIDNLQIKGLIVFSNLVPMVFDQGREYVDEIEFLYFDELDTRL